MGLKFLLFADVPLDAVEFCRDKLYDIPAFEADHMVVAGAPEGLFVPGVILAEAVPGDEAAVDEEVERVVDGRPGGLQPFLAQIRVELVGVKMARHLHDLVQQEEPLPRGPEVLLEEIFLKDIPGGGVIHGGAGHCLDLV